MALKINQIKERLSNLKAQRSLWENHWQEIADYIIPNKATITVEESPGDKRNTHLFDNTAIQSNELLSGALHGLLTNPYSQWFELTSGDPDIDAKDDVRMWLQDTARRMHNTLNDSNFQTEIHEYYIDLCGFGTSPLLMEEDDDTVVRFTSVFIGNIYISENNKGEVDEVYREFEWSARNLVAHFGEEALSKKVLDAYKQDADQKFKVVHATYPNLDTNGGKLSNFKFISQYGICDDDHEISIKGFNEFPFIVGRWAKTSDETYGRGPGMTALPEAKTINKMTEMSLLAAAKVLDPPIQLPDDGFVIPLKTGPGGVNYYRAGTEDRVQSIFNQEIRIDFGEAIMEKHRQRIREAFFVDQLQLGTGPQMTATEVNQRTEEKMRLLGPMLGRQQNELLAPLITRLYGIMARKNLFKPAPQSVKTFGVKYSSSIAKIQRQAEGDAIMKTVQLIGPFVQADPAVLDNFNGDEAAKVIARIYGMPQQIIRPADEVKKMREARDQARMAQQQQQQQMNDAETINKIAPVMPKPQG